MLGQHLGDLSGPGRAPALDGDGQARHLAALAAWRRRTPDERRLAFGDDDAAFQPAIEPARGRVRVGLFCPCLGLGGAEAWQLSLARAVDPGRIAWRGAVVTEGRQGVAPAMLGALAGRMPVGFGLGAARALARACDVIVSWSVLDYRALFRGMDPPPRVALACHFPGERPWSAAAEEWLGRVDRRVAVSELALDSLPGRLRAGTRVIWNAVDDDRLAPTQPVAATRAGWGVPEGARVIGYLGRLSPEKDPAAMLRLADELPPPWHVVLVGDGRERPALADAIRRRGLDRAHLVPGTGAVGDALAAFDGLVVPSRFESFGLTMAEGLRVGIPVIATRSGLARLVPGLVREVGFEPSGPELARAVRLDHEADRPATRDRVLRARVFAADRLDLSRFGREWTNLIVDLARSGRAVPSEEGTCLAMT